MRGVFNVDSISHEACIQVTCMPFWASKCVLWIYLNAYPLACRLTSNIFPWCTFYNLEDLPDFPAIADELAFAGKLARAYDQRLTFHPSHFVKVAAAQEELLQRSLKELEVHSQVPAFSHQFPLPIMPCRGFSESFKAYRCMQKMQLCAQGACISLYCRLDGRCSLQSRAGNAFPCCSARPALPLLAVATRSACTWLSKFG